MNGFANALLPLTSSLGTVPLWHWRYLMSHLIAIAVAGFLLWLAVNRLEWFRFTRQKYSQSQAALFAELCHAHKLSRADRTLLALVAQTKGPGQVCCVFVDEQVILQFAQNNPGDAESCLDLCR